MKGIYDTIMEEMFSREVYMCETYAPYFIASHSIHCFNLMNQRNRVYWAGKDVPNMRLHLVFVAPPGYMKSYYMTQFAGGSSGIYKNAGISIGVAETVTEAAYVGTLSTTNGFPKRLSGLAERHKEGLLLVDEFSAVTNACKSQINSSLDAQLLASLDHGHVVKDLAAGTIDFVTNLTLWTGIQPARYDLSSGLGRRMCFLLFLPTQQDNDNLLKAVHHARNMEPDMSQLRLLWARLKKFKEGFKEIEKVTFSDDVLSLYSKMGLFSYDSNYFDRLLLGLTLAKDGYSKEVHVEVNDKEIRVILQREKAWRDTIMMGAEHAQVEKILAIHGGTMTIREITKASVMYGWDAQRVGRVVNEMMRIGMIDRKGNVIELV